jgi:DNA-binding response OmpR family regulator
MRIMLIDDDRAFIDIARFILERNGHTVEVFFESGKALDLFSRVQPHLLVTDYNIDQMSGVDVTRIIRRTSIVPVMLVSSQLLSLDDEVKAIDAGVDLFMSKPIEPKKFLAYVNALTRRASLISDSAYSNNSGSYNNSGSTIMRKDLVMDLDSYEVYKNGQSVTLTSTEFRLLHYLMTNAGRVLKPESICERLWGTDDPDSVKILKTHVSRLRQKLGDDARNPEYISTIVGSGYVFKIDKEKSESLAVRV